MQRIFINDTKEEFVCSWDREEFRIGAGEELVLEAFLANHFAKHLAKREARREVEAKNDKLGLTGRKRKAATVGDQERWFKKFVRDVDIKESNSLKAMIEIQRRQRAEMEAEKAAAKPKKTKAKKEEEEASGEFEGK